MSARPSVWGAVFAKRTYLSGVCWSIGLLLTLRDQSQFVPGWLAVRTDPAGLFFAASALIGGANFAKAAVRAVAKRALDMNFLMGTAILAAVLVGEPFEAATLAFLFSVAELLEHFAIDRSRRAVTALLELTPEAVDLLLPDGGVARTPLAEIRTGDRIRIRPGDRVGADGRVLVGAASVNESAITGESLPRVVEPGDRVYAGSLSSDGALDIEVTADPQKSVLARIVQLVRAAEARRAPIEQFVQRFAKVYTPLVTLLALLVMIAPPLLGFGPWLEWFMRGITLLVIACPCALVIATPLTIVSALTSAARHGVLIKGGDHLEQLAVVRALATDKTGTLTTGQLAVDGIEVIPATAEMSMLALLATIESRSEHPAAKAIVRYAASRGIQPGDDITDFVSYPGKGVVAQVGGDQVTVGSLRLFDQSVVASFAPARPGSLRVFGRTETGVAAVVTLRDTERPEARALLVALHELGIRPVVMLTGDVESVAREVGQAVGIDEVRAPLLPEEKLLAIAELRAQHGSVAMVGDGVNDAPALAEASVGIAMGGVGSPAAIETADITLMSDNLLHIPYVVSLAKRTRRTIRVNIGAALVLKGILAVGAMLGVVNLAVAVVVGDMGGTLLVMLNAMRLVALRPARVVE